MAEHEIGIYPLDKKDGVFTIKYLGQIYEMTDEDLVANGYNPDEVLNSLRSSGWSERKPSPVAGQAAKAELVKEVTTEAAKAELVKEVTADNGSSVKDILNGYVPTTDIIWSAGKTRSKSSGENDEKATILMLHLMSQPGNLKKFREGNSRGMFVRIAEQLQEVGFLLGEKVKSREKVSNKYQALRKAFRNYKVESAQSGNGAKDKPKFYDEILEIEGSGNHATDPPVVLDSMKKPVIPSITTKPVPIVDLIDSGSPQTVYRGLKSSLNFTSSPGGSKWDQSIESIDFASEDDVDTVPAVGVTPVKKKMRYSSKRETTDFLKSFEKKLEEKSRASDESRDSAVSVIKAYMEKKEKEREEDRQYRREKDLRSQNQTDQFLGIFSQYVKNMTSSKKSKKREKQSDSDSS